MVYSVKYCLEFSPSAVKELSRLDRVMQCIIKEKLVLLADNPAVLKNNIKSLSGIYKGMFRLRVLDYRVIFQVKNEVVTIIILRIGHRGAIYD